MRVGILVVVVLGVVGGSIWVRRGGFETGASLWERDVAAAAMFERGEYEAAAAAYAALLREAPGNLRFQFYEAAARLQTGDVTAWDAVARLADDPDAPPDAALLHADRLIELDRAADAVGYLEDGVARLQDETSRGSLLGDVARRRHLLASVYLELGREAEAIPHLRAVTQEPDVEAMVRIDAALQLGRLHAVRAAFRPTAARERRLELDAFTLARELATEELREGRADARLHMALARALLAVREYPQALAQVEEALRTLDDPDLRAELYLLRARHAWAMGDEELAAADIARVVDSAPPASATAFVAAVDLLRSRGDHTRADELLAAGLRVHPGDLGLGLAVARKELATATWEQARDRLVELAEEHPDSARPHLALGDILRSVGDLDGARDAYTEALRRRPDAIAAELRLAGVALSAGGVSDDVTDAALDELEAAADAALERNPQLAVAHVAKAKALLGRSDRAEGEAAAELVEAASALLVRAIELDPLELEAHAFLAYADLRAGGRADEAVLGFERVLGALPDERPRLRLLLAEAYLDAGLPEQALSAAQRVVRALPGERRALELLLRAQIVLRRLEEAFATLEDLEDLDPESLDIVLDQAFVLSSLGRISDAEARLRRAEELAEAVADEDDRYEALGRVADAKAAMYARMGDAEGGFGAYDDLIEATGGRSTAHLRYGRYLLGLGRVADARREFELALAAAPRDVAPRRAICDLFFRVGDVGTELEERIDALAAEHPTSLDVDYLRGKLALARGDLRVARDLLERYVEERADDADGHFALGIVYQRSSRFEDAMSSLTRADELMPQSPEVRVAIAKTRFGWAQALLRRGRVQEAEATLRAAAAGDPDAAAPRRLLAATVSVQGDAALSEREIRLQLRRTPDDPVLIRLLVLNLVAQERLDEARSSLRRVLELVPDDWSAWAYLAELHVQEGELDHAEVAARKGREVAPQEPASLQGLVRVLVERSRGDEAVALLDEAQAAAPREAYYPYLRGLTLRSLARSEEALAAARAALALDAGMGGAFQLGVGLLSEDLGDREGALAFALEHGEATAGEPGPEYLLGLLFAEAGRLDEARSRLQPLVFDQEFPFLPAVIALSQLEAGQARYRQAREVARAGATAYPANADMIYLEAETHLRELAEANDVDVRSGQRELALQALRRTLELDAEHPRAANNLAYLLRVDDEGRREALALIDGLVKRHPGQVTYLHTRAEILLELGDAPRAVQTLDVASRLLDEREALLAERVRAGVPPNQTHEVATERARIRRWREQVAALYPQAVSAAKESR